MQIVYATLGRERHEQRRVASICESCKSLNLWRPSCTFLILASADIKQYSGDPRGKPSRENPSDVTGISERKGWFMEEPAGANIKDFDRLRSKPRGGPSASIIERAAARSSGDPHKVSSSRYQALIRRPGIRHVERVITAKERIN